MNVVFTEMQEICLEIAVVNFQGEECEKAVMDFFPGSSKAFNEEGERRWVYK